MYEAQTTEPHVNGGERTAHDGRYPLKEARKDRNLSRAALAQEVACSPNHIYNIETQRARPSPELARKICGFFDSGEETLFPKGIGSSRDTVAVSEKQDTVLGARLERLRVSRGWSRKQLSTEAGLSTGAIANIEHGKNTVIYPDSAYLLGRAFGVGMEHFEPYIGGPNSSPDDPARGQERTPLTRRLVGLRVEAGLSISGLAERAGIQRATIGNAESGKGAYSRQTANKLAPILGVTAEELLEERKRTVLEPELVPAARAARGRPYCERSFAERLIILREDQGMSRANLAQASRTTKHLIANIECRALEGAVAGGEEGIGHGRAGTAMIVRKLAAALGVSAPELSDASRINPLADRLLDLRAGWGGSQQELGQRIGVHPQQLLSYENAWTLHLSSVHAEALGKFYQVEPRELYVLNRPAEPPEHGHRRRKGPPSASALSLYRTRLEAMLSPADLARESGIPRHRITDAEADDPESLLNVAGDAMVRLERGIEPSGMQKRSPDEARALERALGMNQGTLLPPKTAGYATAAGQPPTPAQQSDEVTAEELDEMFGPDPVHRLRGLAHRQAMYGAELAQRAGINPSSLSRLQPGKGPSDLLLYKLCRALGVPPQSVDPSIGQRVNPLGRFGLGECALRRMKLADLAREADIKPGDLYRIMHHTRSYSRGGADIRRAQQLTSYLERCWSRENGHHDAELKDRVRELKEALFAYQRP